MVNEKDSPQVKVIHPGWLRPKLVHYDCGFEDQSCWRGIAVNHALAHSHQSGHAPAEPMVVYA